MYMDDIFRSIRNQQNNFAYNYEEIIDTVQKSDIISLFERTIEAIQHCLDEGKRLKLMDVKKLINHLVTIYARKIVNSKSNIFIICSCFNYLLLLYIQNVEISFLQFLLLPMNSLTIAYLSYHSKINYNLGSV